MRVKRAWWIAAWLAAMPAVWAASPSEPRASNEHWPSVITQLRQQLDQQPTPALRQQLAVAYNNYGVELADQSQLDDAVAQLERALQFDANNTQFQGNLAMVYLRRGHEAYQARRTDEAAKDVKRALALNPNSAQAYLLLGELEYQRQHLKEARAAWERALKLDPALTDAQQRLERLKSESSVEGDFDKISQAYFDIRYAEGLTREAGLDIRDMLLKARRTIGSQLAYWPTQKLVVLVYSAEQFRRLRQNTPDWVAGQYDGKIRVPLPGPQFDQEAVRRTLFHEYTHALLSHLTHDRLPVWFNEGLAEHEAWDGQARPWVALREAVRQNRVTPWAELSTKFSTVLSAEEVAAAYEEAQTIVDYLAERYGMWRIRRVLSAVGGGTAFEEALAAELRLKLPKVEAEWRKRLPKQVGITD